MLSPALKNFHDRVYVLTIPSATERQANVIEQLGDGNFEFVFGVDKNEVSKEELTLKGIYDESIAMRTDRRSKPMTLGHICCSLGHRMVYEAFLSTDAQTALIFEDDVVVNEVPENTVENAIANVPADAELIYWGWQGGGYRPWFGAAKQTLYHIQHSIGLERYDHTMIKNLYSRPFNEYFDIAGKHFLAHSYTVTRRAAEALIKWNTPIRLNGDNALMYAVLSGDVKGYLSKNQIFGQRSANPNDPLKPLTAT